MEMINLLSMAKNDREISLPSTLSDNFGALWAKSTTQGGTGAVCMLCFEPLVVV